MTKKFEELKRISEQMGYRFETSIDGTEERMIRPDGSVAVIARKTPNRLPVRCCCNPSKLLGWLPVPIGIGIGWGTRISYPIQGEGDTANVITLEVGKYAERDHPRDEPRTELAIMSGDNPIEVFRLIPGFAENHYQ